jgi:hypothetical protein
MPVKHQLHSYRTVKGERYRSWGDVNREDAKAQVAALRDCKMRAFAYHHPDGFSRIFVHEADGRATGILSSRPAASIPAIPRAGAETD